MGAGINKNVKSFNDVRRSLEQVVALIERIGSNFRSGTATLVAGAATVADTETTANTRIFLGKVTPEAGGNDGALTIDSKTAGTGFDILSTDGADTSTVCYLCIEP